jgi:hypothetical protein
MLEDKPENDFLRGILNGVGHQNSIYIYIFRWGAGGRRGSYGFDEFSDGLLT